MKPTVKWRKKSDLIQQNRHRCTNTNTDTHKHRHNHTQTPPPTHIHKDADTTYHTHTHTHTHTVARDSMENEPCEPVGFGQRMWVTGEKDLHQSRTSYIISSEYIIHRNISIPSNTLASVAISTETSLPEKLTCAQEDENEKVNTM